MTRYARAAYLVALAATASPADADDAVQEGFVQAFEHLPECRSPDRFAGWLMRIVRNRAHNIRRREVLRGGGARAAEDAAAATEARPESGTTIESPDERVERRELRDHLLKALAEESSVRREVLLLHDLEDWTHAEIARALGISELMSRYHLSVVRRSMRARLARYRHHREDL